MDASHSDRELLSIRKSHNLINVTLHGSYALLVKTYRIQTHSVEVGNLLLDGAYLSLALEHSREEVVDLQLIVLCQHLEYAIA